MGLLLYHTGFDEIRAPDIRRGRKNADFGQGFYLSTDPAFSRRWARTRKGLETRINAYELEADGLAVKVFDRSAAWFEYIFSNRNGRADALEDRDVVVGPIANDTIFDIFGITTSGYLTGGQALALLSVGPEYTQVALKSEKAAAALRFLSSSVIDAEEIARCRETVRREEAAYQEQVAALLRRFFGD